VPLRRVIGPIIEVAVIAFAAIVAIVLPEMPS
jgi:hypothetical protein